ncbi:hypothetical protein D9619_003978 [Psilocybe cf. subviscida]|uniref:Mannosyltransferase n=1 Tax=Psilocybe cf. subviscida TaxID=2480587 RepID=A0A8H5BQ77_9AGAR|nr:hypothetical protein D9619_003978 [Psilocybe cf. subviscida]
MSIVLDALIFATACGHVLIAPYSKVEESFSLHAAHDVLMYGVGADAISKYDHLIFPGAVPRTFIGSVLLAWLTDPVARLAHSGGYLTSKLDLQILLRLVLASLNAWTLCMLRRAASRRFGRTTGLFFALLTCTQFHLPFWMGRTIPNMLAMIPFNTATYLLFDRAPSAPNPSRKSITIAVSLLVFTAVVLRAEVALFLGPLCLQLLYLRQVGFVRLLKIGLLSTAISVALTLGADSYFWGETIWPEFSSVYFNVVQGQSSEWGTSPPWTYVAVFLPKLLLGALPLAFIGLASDHRVRAMLLPAGVFIALISCLGHKEWRFIVYLVPLFNIAAARGSRYLVTRRKSTLFGKLAFLLAVGIPLANLVITALLTRASMTNYPGGEAMTALHRLHSSEAQPPSQAPAKVHLSNLAAQTGASLFTQLLAAPYFLPELDATLKSHSPTGSDWVYDKTENISLLSLLQSPAPSQSQSHSSGTQLTGYTHLVVEEDPNYVLESQRLGDRWRVVEVLKAFDAWVLDWAALKSLLKDPLGSLKDGDGLRDVLLATMRRVPYVKESEKLWILERRDADT